jgi:hypothetical protein
MGTYAYVLCAKLVVPSPCVMLGAHHDAALDCSLPWSQYVDFGTVGGSIVRESPELTSSATKYDHPTSLRIGNIDGIRRVEIKRGDLGAAFDFFEKNQSSPFILTIQLADTWLHIIGSTCNALVNTRLRGELGCNGVVCLPPKLAFSVAEEMLRMFDGEGNWAVLHLRRGDTLKFGCDNSPERVGQFLKCHIRGNYTAIFFFTDDQNPAYIEKVSNVIGTIAMHPVHGDIMAKRLLEKKQAGAVDNYLVYSTFSALKSLARASGHLELRFGHASAQYCDLQVACSPAVDNRDHPGTP